MTAQFTPGPWRADPDLREGMAWNVHIYEGADNRVCFMSNGTNSEANARLIAAAPELYEALEWAERLLSNHTVHEDDLPPIQAALAKARGDTA